MDSFMEGNFWGDNEIYVDTKKDLYIALGLGKGSATDMLNKRVIEHKKKADEAGVQGNMSGDGMQLGGTYVIDKGGKILMEFQQQKWGDHPTKESILEALNIDLNEMKDAEI
mmetsp:Transcript_9159/g.11433  ORF Transcript_9159/g.11433 Transcript_9159/m.11433 type:complete len:112 (+) Transcript_9159:514-849(+)